MGGPRGFKTMVSNANLSAETNLFRGNYLKEKLLCFDLQYGGIVTWLQIKDSWVISPRLILKQSREQELPE